MTDPRDSARGIYAVWKPVGMTSHDVVHRIRKVTGIKKVGHAGTLDPAAEGILVVCVGREFTRTISTVAATEKEYMVGLKLGIVTDSYDREGAVISCQPVTVDEQDVRKTIEKYVGTIQQTPPMFSAVHYKGKRLYELARKGIEVERGSRTVEISSITVETIEDGPNPEYTLRVICGSGTYIRALCHDIGRDLGCGAHASFIVRTRVGEYSRQDAVPIEEFTSADIQ